MQIMKIPTGSHRSPSIVDMNPCHWGHGSTWRNPQLLPKTSKKNFVQFTPEFLFQHSVKIHPKKNTTCNQGFSIKNL